MRKYIFYLDGKFLNANASLLETFTPGQHIWHGVFETMRAVDGKVELLDEHLERLMRGLKALKIRHHYTLTGMKRIVRQVSARNPSIKLGRVRVMVFSVDRSVHCAVMILAYRPPLAKQYREGLRAMVIKTKQPATARLAEVKSLDYSLFSGTYHYARAQGYDEALLVNAKGHVFEASRGNIFIFKSGTLITPPLSSGCLNGIIRRRIIAIARDLKIPVLEKDLTVPMVKASGNIFLTNSMMGIIPAVL